MQASEAVFQVIVENPTNGRKHNYVSKTNSMAAIGRIIDRVADKTPIGDLPDESIDWLVTVQTWRQG